MINFRYQIITAKGGARQLLYTSSSREEAIKYLSFILSGRDLSEPLEYIIKPVIFVTEEVKKQ